MSPQGFSKHERIVSQKLIDELFTGGQSHSLAAFPLRAVYLLCPAVAQPPAPDASAVAKVQLLLSVPKRRFKHAVDRNRVKRQLREAFRKNRALLTEAVAEGHCVALSFIWMSDKHFASSEVEQRVITLLKRVAAAIAPHVKEEEN
ncbi:MAG: ribonuclease P protein component [Prevotella sp.]|nr:ribonuclease P protein component [Prevotella sp.]